MADLIISQPMTFTVDVKNGLVERPQRESLMRGDRMANRIIAELVYGSEPFDITGVTVKGKFCRPPSGDEIDLAGEAKGNVAEVQLTDQCYTSGGHYEARVILVLGGVERTVLFISGDVLKSGSGNAAGDEETGGSGGSTGSGLPAGGTAGQVLVKVSSAQGDAIWKKLTAADVGALPSDGTAVNATQLNGKSADKYAMKTDLPTKASDIGALAKDEQAADSYKLDGKDSVYYHKKLSHPRNLLDNSDFTNPVNQRGKTSYTGAGYTIDRWYAITAENNVTVNNGDSLTINGFIRQKVTVPDGRYTIATKTTDGAVHIRQVELSGNAVTNNAGDENLYAVYEGDYYAIGINSGNYLWAALYEGSYTADNLPPYVSKGDITEKLSCMHYYTEILRAVCAGAKNSDGTVVVFVPIPVAMRQGVIPTVEFANNLWAYAASGVYQLTIVKCRVTNSGMIMDCTCTSSTNEAITMPDVGCTISLDL